MTVQWINEFDTRWCHKAHSDTVTMVNKWLPGYEGSVCQRRFVIIKAVKQLWLGGTWRRQRFGPDSGRRSRGQLVVSGCGQSLLGRGICWFQTLLEHRSCDWILNHQKCIFTSLMKCYWNVLFVYVKVIILKTNTCQESTYKRSCFSY